MSFFKGVKKAKGLEKPQDSLGTGGAKSDVYPVVITAAYGIDSTKSDAQAVKLEAKIKDSERKLFGTFWITNGDGAIYSERDGKKKFVSGYLLVDSIALIATEGDAGILDLETEEKTIKVKRDGKEVNETVDSFPDLIGAEIQIGVIATKKFKQNNVDGKYVDTDEVQVIGEWHTIFDEEGFTLNELESEADEPKFKEEWLKVWKDKERDFTQNKKQDSKAKGGRRTSSESGPKSRTANRRSMIRN